MDFRSLVDQVKSAFVIGKGNTYLHGGMPGRQEAQGQYEQQQNPAAQAAYVQNNQSYQSPYQQPANPYAANQQGYPQTQQPDFYGQTQEAYGYPQQQAAVQGQPWQQASAPVGQQGFSQPYGQTQNQQPEARQSAGYETQMDPYAQESGRNRRSRQHQETKQPDPVYAQQQAAAQNIVQFPGAAPQTSQEASSGIDAYVINVFNINSCRQAMSCLRRGQCTLIVMDQLVDKAEIRRYVDMLTGACYALNGTMTRLSSKIGFYIMAPAAMTVYTDPTTSNANTPQPRPPQAPLYQGPSAQSYQAGRPANEFSQQSAYPPAPQMNFAAQQQQQQQQQAQPRQEVYEQNQQQEYQQPAASAYPPYGDDSQRYAAQ